MATSKEKIVITGARGLLGSALCSHFDEKYNVIGLSHQECDITDKDEIEKKIIKQNPNILINAAGITKVDDCERNPTKAKEVNIIGTENLVSACKRLDCLMVQISTDYVFDGEKDSAYIEDDIPNPLSVYAGTKFEAEEAVKNILDRFFIIRTSWLFGKKNRDFVDVVINRIEDDLPLEIVNDKFSIPTYNFDLAKALEDLLSKVNDYGVYHITNKGGCSWYDFAKEIAKSYLGKGVNIEPTSLKKLGLIAKRPKNSVLDNSKFSKAVGYELRPWQEALREYINLCYKN